MVELSIVPLTITSNIFIHSCNVGLVLKKSFHTTRHTFASRCAMNGWSIAEISAQGGWKNLSILKRYTHIKATYLSEKLAN